MRANGDNTDPFSCTSCRQQRHFDQAVCTAQRSQPVLMDRARKLLVDDRWVSSSSGLRRVLGVASRMQRPVVAVDRPWEAHLHYQVHAVRFAGAVQVLS